MSSAVPPFRLPSIAHAVKLALNRPTPQSVWNRSQSLVASRIDSGVARPSDEGVVVAFVRHLVLEIHRDPLGSGPRTDSTNRWIRLADESFAHLKAGTAIGLGTIVAVSEISAESDAEAEVQARSCS